MAKKYYPKLWPKGRLQKLAEAGKLTEAEYMSIVVEETV